MKVQVQSAIESDLSLLTVMNQQLIKDEGSQNPMNYKQLRERMLDWIKGDWHVDLLLADDEVIGYAVY
jgi:hypothetical protein